MNREIFCRAKRSDTSTWVFGSYVGALGGKHYIIQAWSYKPELWDYFEVIPSTVGQFITKIGEHKVFDGDRYCIKHSQYEYFVKIEDGLQAICYHSNKLDWDDKSPMRWGLLYRIKELGWEKEFHITGNVHDNPINP